MPLRNVLAVILGGGQGTRLYPLTKIRTKPAVPIGGKYRLIDVVMSNCLNSGINHVFILTQFLPASLHRHVHRTYQFDVFSGGSVEILPAEQTPNGEGWYKGTADAVRRQLARILSRSPREVLILAGDHLYRMDYRPFIDRHRETGADLTIAVLPVSEQEASHFGILKADASGRVVAFQEKPQEPDSLACLVSRPGDAQLYLASMGIYVFQTDVLVRLLEAGGDDFGRHIIPAALKGNHVQAFPFEGYWRDIGTMTAFYEANLAMTRPDPPFSFYDREQPIYTRSRFLPPSRIDQCRLEQAIVTEGCWLYEADISQCVVGLRSVVRPGARLRQVVMMGADFYQTPAEMAEARRLGRPRLGIGRGACIERAIIDKNACIGRGVVIRSHEGEADRDDTLYSIREGITVIPKGAVVPDNTVI
jgi:glucose-1-phosphate adenylyltransferase